jgi:hypothetical protein
MARIDPAGTTPRTKVERSRFSLLEGLSNCSLTSDNNWEDEIPSENDVSFYSSLNAQISFFRQNYPMFAQIRTIAEVFRMSNATFYKMFLTVLKPDEIVSLAIPIARRGGPLLVPPEIEKKLIDEILRQQQKGDCPSPRECRLLLSDLLSTGTRTVIIDLHWWRQFLKRTAILAVQRCDAREIARSAVQKADVIPYVTSLLKMVSGKLHPDLVVNMDESGFYHRPHKESQKSCVFIWTAGVKPRFLEVPGANHVTIVGTVSLSGHDLLPLLLSTRVHLTGEIRMSYLHTEFQYYHTAKGYLTSDAMDYWVDHVLMPYVASARTRLWHSFPLFLILDGLKVHFTPHVYEVFGQENVIIIPLPPYASHLYQILDLCLFGVMKKECKQSRTGRASSSLYDKSIQKIERVVRAWHHACFIGAVLAAWRSAGSLYEWDDAIIQRIRVNPTLILTKLTQ